MDEKRKESMDTERTKKEGKSGNGGRSGARETGGLQEFGSWLKKDNRVLAVVGVTAVVLIGVGIGIGWGIGKSSSSKTEPVASATAETGTQTETPSETGSVVAALEENAYPEINSLMQKYFQALKEGDTETIKTLKDYTEDRELIRIKEKSKYLDHYDNVNCYTKPGMAEDTYVVYVSYEAWFTGFETAAPGLTPLYVMKNEEGQYFIHDLDQDSVTRNYVNQVTAQDDAVDLYNKVQVAYNEAVTSDEGLGAFLEQLPETLRVAVGDALVELETASETPTEAASEPNADDGADGAQTASANVKATDVVNIRKSDSETADVLGKAAVGDTFRLLENRGNGWSKIDYNGQEAFIKTEFLADAGTASEDGGSSQADASDDNTPSGDAGDNSSDTGGQASNQGGSSKVPDSGSYTLQDTVNVRKSASETAEKLGVCYAGETLEIVMKQADGWTKVKYKGNTGYVKSDVLK